jgi:hypothetical protein
VHTYFSSQSAIKLLKKRKHRNFGSYESIKLLKRRSTGLFQQLKDQIATETQKVKETSGAEAP